VASDLKRDYSRTFYADLAMLDPTRVGQQIAEMEATASDWLASAGIPHERRALLRAADVRYRRQAYELTVPLGPGPITRSGLDRLAADFHEKHRQTYGHANPEEPVQLVNLRLTAIGRLQSISLTQRANPAAARRRVREVWFPKNGFAPCPVHWRAGLAPGEALPGPAIVEAVDSTIIVPPGWLAAVDAKSYIRLTRR
jgi:N-methylhydantoinase A